MKREMISIFCILLFCAPMAMAQTQWWDESYSYRRLIGCNTTHSAYTGGQHFFVILDFATNTDSIQDDLDDARFVFQTSGGTTDVGRYFVSPNTATTDVWFESQENLATNADLDQQTNKYYMYYGYTDAASPTTYVNVDCIDAPYSVDANTTALWHMDEASWNGTTGEADDATGTSDGTRRGGATTTTTSKFGMAGVFDATDDWVNCGTATVNPGQHFTIEGWCRRTGAGSSSGRNLFSKAYAATAPYASWCLELSATNTLCFSTGATDNVYTNTPQTAAIDSAVWYHVAGTYDSTYKRIYLNGTKGDSLSYTKVIAWNADTTDLGATHYNLANNVWGGQVDEVRFSNVVRTAFYHVATAATLDFGAVEIVPSGEAGTYRRRIVLTGE